MKADAIQSVITRKIWEPFEKRNELRYRSGERQEVHGWILPCCFSLAVSRVLALFEKERRGKGRGEVGVIHS